jgi:hypothetical protein
MAATLRIAEGPNVEAAAGTGQADPGTGLGDECEAFLAGEWIEHPS